MALDRQSIEKKDFPVGRRGYDPEAVDSHLNALADEIADFKRSARRRSDTLASSASDQVRAIVEAAESSAADIQRDAETEARDIREEANSEAQATREQASEQAREYVGTVSEATASMLSRLDGMESELTGMVESLRTGANRLDADLRLLESSLSAASDVVVPRPRFEPEPQAAAAAPTEPAAEPEHPSAESEHPSAESEPAVETSEPAANGAVSVDDPYIGGDAPPAEAPDGGQAEGPGDSEGARLIALNMALNGTPREETARYLSENFQLLDRDGLLDEVYASVEG